MTETSIIVTDHAVIRYLERAHGIDVEQLRRHIAALATTGVDLGAAAVIVEGVKLILQDAKVVTVYQRNWPSRNLSREVVDD